MPKETLICAYFGCFFKAIDRKTIGCFEKICHHLGWSVISGALLPLSCLGLRWVLFIIGYVVLFLWDWATRPEGCCPPLLLIYGYEYFIGVYFHKLNASFSMDNSYFLNVYCLIVYFYFLHLGMVLESYRNGVGQCSHIDVLSSRLIQHS